ncbi:uncharacterized protein TNIN_12671 [Trichonephila inaurata madagascariensis]|uniref:Uncharacterized protein n=1 Tax=Trichonephila inaurata madagascariensis TaxID=2747483 RepID=A0A8X6XM45_9ARAC|nr:uncharacterized protein TNIN_12671 [Trichonephila inaurata madagascariensis]
MFRNATLLGSFLLVLRSIVSLAMENATVGHFVFRRVLFGLWMITASIMPFFYKINFLSFLIMPENVPIPRTFKELSEAVFSGKYKCPTTSESIDINVLRGRRIDCILKLGDAIEKND